LYDPQCCECGSNNVTEFSGDRLHCLDCGVLQDKNQKYTPILNEDNTISKTVSESSWKKVVKVGNSEEKNIARTLGVIIKIVDELKLGRDVTEQAAENYRRLYIKSSFKGRKLASIAASCVYLACKQRKRPVSLTKIAETADIPRKAVGRDYKYLLSRTRSKRRPITLGQDYTICLNKLAKSEEHRRISLQILDAARSSKLTLGVNPLGVVAGCVYYSAKILGIKTTFRKLSEISRVTEKTIQTRNKELMNSLQVEIKL